MPVSLEWFGLLATVAGTGLSLWAALAARGARQQAREAKEAAIRLGRIVQLADLQQEVSDLQAVLARYDFPLLAALSTRLRGRIARFSAESYTEVGESATDHLRVARDQIFIIGQVAASSRKTDENRAADIQRALGEITASLGAVHAVFYARIVEQVT
jgi:hypothetical protein